MSDLFQIADGKTVVDERISEKLFLISSIHPESAQEDSTSYEWDERGMAELFALTYSQECRYCYEHKSWYTYRDGVWKKDQDALLVMSKIIEFTRILTLYSSTITDNDKRESYIKFMTKVGDRRFRERLIKDAANNDSLLISASMFDSNPYLINCKNVTVDLSSGDYHEHNPNDLLTMQTRFSYTPWLHNECPRWNKFINEVMSGDENKVKYLQKALGYSILGKGNEECMFLFYGKTTRNGKSTLLNTIEHLLGDYSSVSPVSIICKSTSNKSAEQANPMIASLKGKRFVTMAESNQYGKLDEEQIKQLTGGEEIKARNLYEKPITFLPQFTLFLSCNDLPMVQDKSLFYSDRLRVIEFNRHFKAEEQDKNLKNFFCQEESMRGIFAWLVEGYQLYTKEGLKMPDVVQKAVNQYAKDNDLVELFLEEKCEIKDEGMMKSKVLYETYKMWCQANNSYACSARKFYAEMDTHMEWYKDLKSRDGYKMYVGLCFKGE